MDNLGDSPECQECQFWIEYAASHLSREGFASILAAKDSVFLKKGNERNEPRIHKELIETNRLDCIVTLPDKVLLIAGISLSILILAMDRGAKNGRHRYRNRGDEILFIDASALPSMKILKNREFTIFDLNKIVSVYHKWGDFFEDPKTFVKPLRGNLFRYGY